MTPIRVVLESDLHVLLKADKEDGHRQCEDNKGNYLLVDMHTWKDGVDESPLCKRGWVTQERALSVRTLHFGRQQIFWECLCEDGSEVFPKGFACGTARRNPKLFLSSRTKQKEKRMKKLQEVHEQAEKRNEERRAFYRNLDLWSHDDSDDELFPLPPELEPFVYKMESLALTPEDFEGCDIDSLDGLGIEGWEKFKNKLRKWGVGKQAVAQGNVEARPIRGMTLEQRQWCTVVEVYSGCALSYSKDKLIAVSGMANTISQDMNCAYLAGMWRRDLEHQLLWKVKNAMPDVKRDITRAPSWSWASVDCAVKIPAWDGYFYH